MSWFGAGGNAEFEAQVERATSSSLEDVPLNLEIADYVRSKTVQPKDAMRSLKKRIGNKNPNIQLSALNLADTCAKNGGSHFMQEIASREFMDNLVSLLKVPGYSESNREVQSKILELIQNWAVGAQGKDSLNYLMETYRSLQHEGFQFPPRQEIASSMFDSTAPPEWTDSDVCMRCREKFTFTNRKHHCRNCGNVFCGNCSSKNLPLPQLGIMQPVRVDDGCYSKLTDKARVIPGPQSPSGGHSRTLWQDSAQHHHHHHHSREQPRGSRTTDDSFDADLKRALALSLEESRGSHSQVQVTSQPQPQQQHVTPKPHTNGTSKSASKQEDDEDADLKAAIAASLQDMEEQKVRHAKELKEQSSKVATTSQYKPNSQFELTAVEAENINLFSTLVDRLQRQPPGTILREPQIQELYESIGKLRPKLARTYGETMSKHDTLLDLHSKLSTVVRYYDKMLEDRMASAYTSTRSGQMPGRNMYPDLGPSAPALDTSGLMESYYSGGPPQMDSYHATPQPGYPYQQNPPQSNAPYPSFDKRTSSYGAALPEASYYQGQQASYAAVPAQTPYPQPTQGEPQPQAPHPQRRASNQYSQRSSQYAPSHGSQASNPAVTSPPAESNAGFYYGDQHASAPQSQQPQQPQPPSPEIYHQPPPQQVQPQLNLYQQAQPPQYQTSNPPQSHPPLSRQISRHYHPLHQLQLQQQQTSMSHATQQQWPQAPAAGAGYGQESFPSVPQHAPVPVKEESLIEL